MKKYKLSISYDGRAYCGWQKQPNGFSIQEAIEDKLQIVLRHPTLITGSGRTDAGVHAYEQIAHFESKINITPRSFIKSVNSLLSEDIRILKIDEVELDFHARYSAKGKIYHYNLWLEPVLSPFKKDYHHQVRPDFNINLLAAATPLFIGEHNFASFANQANMGSAARNPVRNIKRIDIIPQEGGVRLEFEANGFLYKMVRNITGTLLEIGYGKRNLNSISELLNVQDRRRAGGAAPAKGLFLYKVNY